MARFIDADKIELEPTNSVMNGVLILGGQPGKTFSMLKAMLKVMINNQPTVDAVEVVRCKDCKHSRVASFGERYCNRDKTVELGELKEDDFCSYGEKKGE